MDKMRMESLDLTSENIEKIEALFPNVITETKDESGKLKKAINFELLKQMLSADVLEGDEAYEFTWVGKKASIVETGKPIRKTLRPCKEESKNWDTTENLYIEGDNLDVLKLLQESYLDSIKMIYIDPPYNTGKDNFLYPDDFKMNNEEYEEKIDYRDAEGNIQFKQNNSSNPRFHSDWCSKIYPLLKHANNLLDDDGVIFISIDDNEVHNLRKMLDEVFGENNLIAQINWKGRGGRQDSKHFAVIHEYILCYAKNAYDFTAGDEIKQVDIYLKYDKIKKRNYKTQLARKWGSNSKRSDRPNLYYSITAPDNSLVYPMLSESEEGRWRWGKVRMKSEIESGNVEFVKNEKGWVVYEKIFQPLEGEESTRKYTTWIDDVAAGTGSGILKKLFGRNVFDYPKPTDLLKRFMVMANTSDEDIILDFYSGSATTAHAVLQLNAEDSGNRKFIMIQVPEICDEESEAYKAGYNTISEIGKERIRRAGDNIKNEAGLMAHDLDIGFRVLKLDDTNMKDVYYSADGYSQDLLFSLESNIKEDRTDLDLLFGCLLEWGLPLSMPYTSETIDGFTVHTYNNGDLIACFDKNIPDSVVKEIARRQPLRVVFRDSSFADTPAKINVEEIFKLLSPNTSLKVL